MTTYTNILHNPATKTITVLDRLTLDVQRVLSIKNVRNNVFLYNRDNNVGGNTISVAGNVITYDYSNVVFLANEPVIIEYEAEPAKTYSATVKGLLIANATTDFLTLQGNALKLVKVKKIEVFFRTTGSDSAAYLSLIRRSSANTGGTSVVVAGAKFDTVSPTHGAVLTSYTANPATLGTLVATLDDHRIEVTDTNTPPAVFQEIYEEFGGAETPTLRGTSDFFAWNLNGFTATGTETIDIHIVWTEE
jgi:hypothetical protein